MQNRLSSIIKGPSLVEDTDKENIQMRTIVLANLLTCAVLSILYMNYLLLGETFFIFFAAFVTSVGLRSIRESFLNTLVEIQKEPVSLLRNTFIG